MPKSKKEEEKVEEPVDPGSPPSPEPTGWGVAPREPQQPGGDLDG